MILSIIEFSISRVIDLFFDFSYPLSRWYAPHRREKEKKKQLLWCQMSSSIIITSSSQSQCFKITQNVAHLNFPGFDLPIKNDLSGNIVWPQASGFQKFAKNGPFWAFFGSQCWVRLFSVIFKQRDCVSSNCSRRMSIWVVLLGKLAVLICSGVSPKSKPKKIC